MSGVSKSLIPGRDLFGAEEEMKKLIVVTLAVAFLVGFIISYVLAVMLFMAAAFSSPFAIPLAIWWFIARKQKAVRQGRTRADQPACPGLTGILLRGCEPVSAFLQTSAPAVMPILNMGFFVLKNNPELIFWVVLVLISRRGSAVCRGMGITAEPPNVRCSLCGGGEHDLELLNEFQRRLHGSELLHDLLYPLEPHPCPPQEVDQG